MEVQVMQGEEQLSLSNGSITLEYNLKTGKAEIAGGNGIVLSGVHAFAKLADGACLCSTKEELCRRADVEEITDAFGHGSKVTLWNEGQDGKTLVQKFYLYENLPYLIAEVLLKAEETIGSNEIAVLMAEHVSLPERNDLRYLFAPYDNDDFVRYEALPFDEIKESYEISAVYDSVTRNGMIVGSISHDTWKTGITAQKESDAVLGGLKVTAGVTSKLTRDTLPHGTVYGNIVSSPKVFVGFYQDYRDGLETYGKANGIIAPPVKWEKGVPIGWNSWAALATKLTYDSYIAASDFIKEELQPKGYSAEGRVYVNFDSFWTNLREEQLISAAAHVRANGQIPGIYTTPFTFWGKPEQAGAVPGTNGRYQWKDILLKDGEGKILPPYDGGYCIDPTHPGNKLRLEYEFEQFKRWGYSFVKMDFIAHGAVEGEHYDKNITTGIAAYNYGMQQINDILAEDLGRQEFFLSASIAPTFPGQYVHGRRVSCDVFGTINWTEYMLNSLTYGWWLNDAVYRFNDPDHIVLYNSYNYEEPILFNEALSRYFSAVIAGTMILSSVDYRVEAGRQRAREILTNPEVMDVARAGRTFRPVEGNTGNQAGDTFYRMEADGSCYLALFNFSNTEKKQMTLSMERIGLSGEAGYVVRDLWSKEELSVKGHLYVELEEAQPKLFQIRRAE